MECPFSIPLLILSSFYLLTCTREDKITVGQSITTNQTITSQDGIFSLGFFCPHSSTNRYVGIRYPNIPVQTVVWVANRENPVTDSSGVLTITQDGNLAFLGTTENILWSSNVSIPARRNTTAILLDDGNLVLRDDSQSVLWQSFDYPSFLPCMKLSANLKTGESTCIFSWKDVNNPTPGEFSFCMDPHTPCQLIVLRRSDKYWRSDVGLLGAVTVLEKNIVPCLATVTDDLETYFTITITGGMIMVRYFLAPTGLVQALIWEEDSRKWKPNISFPMIGCDFYAPMWSICYL